MEIYCGGLRSFILRPKVTHSHHLNDKSMEVLNHEI